MPCKLYRVPTYTMCILQDSLYFNFFFFVFAMNGLKYTNNHDNHSAKISFRPKDSYETGLCF